ncbi:uncharacterized protein LOC116288183 [Actinia tenebrosa]|uniref:Uncharacterized protein LOC116288183 n=1 Tax=Actinia tenebrosa TaxID=6105 RepID=A0A6P8H5Q1_ACTTE|nr:uncharacterized protein LOC116288183 [Actinia tenebrosa]
METNRGLFYKYELLKEIWCEQLSKSTQRFLSEDYFKNFLLHHGSFCFYIVKTNDGSSQLMLDEEQYQAVKGRLQHKTRTELREIPSQIFADGKGNVLKERKSFLSQEELEKELKNLKENERTVFRRARQSASELKANLCQMVSKNPNMKFISYDVEIYDQDQKTILEIGYVKFTLKESDNPEHHHAIVNEELHNREGFDNKKKFKFGATKHVPLEEAVAFLQRYRRLRCSGDSLGLPW